LPIPTAQFRFGEKEMPLKREWFLPAVYNKGYSNARRSDGEFQSAVVIEKIETGVSGYQRGLLRQDKAAKFFVLHKHSRSN
jgi:hypothetical protein